MFPKLAFLLGLAASTNACDPWEKDLGKGGSKSYKPEDCSPAEWSAGGRCRKIADEMVRLQYASGGFCKCIYPIGPDPSVNPLTGLNPKDKKDGRGCLDNGATVWEIRFLAHAYFATGKNKTYRDAANEGIDFVFRAEHTDGGWPQYHPLGEGRSYQDAVTFNDGLHLSVMDLMNDIADQKKPFHKNPFKKKYRGKAGAALARGLNIILDTQIDDRQWAGGSCPRKIGWCAQHDRNTLEPVDARDYEPTSYSGNEGLDLARYLMEQPNPSQAIKDAVLGAWVFTKRYVIEGCVLETVNGDREMSKCPDPDVEDECPDRWPRFADLDQTRPIFCDRKCTENSTLEYNDVPDGFNEVDEERRNGYAYSNEGWGKEFLSEFNGWKTREGVSEPDLSCVNRGSGAALTCSSGGSGGSGDCPGECFDRCEEEYGGDITGGDAYSCAKGCATMKNGDVDDPSKYCDKDEDDRFDDCNKSCDKSSSNSSKVNKCKFGCEFWCSKGCIDRCTERYGGDGLTGDSYYCAKGCAGMKSNKLDNPSKFCDKDEDERYDDCKDDCNSASGSTSKQNMCKYGCEYWN